MSIKTFVVVLLCCCYVLIVFCCCVVFIVVLVPASIGTDMLSSVMMKCSFQLAMEQIGVARDSRYYY